MTKILNNRLWLVAVLVALGMIGAAMALRPLWRDEIWTLFFSARELSFQDAVSVRMTRDVHPPLYFVLQHFWRIPFEDGHWARAFNLIVLALGGLGLWALGRKRGAETALFLLLCLGSYWVIYFSIEARMYLMLFAACGAATLAIRNAVARQDNAFGEAALFAVFGFVAAGVHFFGALWIAVAGAWTGLTLLKRAKPGGFFAWALASLIAIAPTIAWIAIVRPQDNPVVSDLMPLGDAFAHGANQFLRGLVVKTFGSNLALFIAALLCMPALARRKDPFDAVMALAILSTVAIVFALHLFWTPLIKERAFIVIMPAVILLMARAVLSHDPERPGATRRLVAWIPIVATISPFLFWGEYFKDRERWDDIRAAIADGACAGQPVVAHYNPVSQAEGYNRFLTDYALRGAADGQDVKLVDAHELARTHALVPASTCPVRAIALALPKGEEGPRALALENLRAAGLPLDQLEERRLGGGRNIMWVERDTATHEPN